MAVYESKHGRIQDGYHLQVEWECISEVFFVQNGWIQDGRIHDVCHPQVESEWMSVGFFVQMVGTNLGKTQWVWEGKLRWPNTKWQNSRWLPSSSWVIMIGFQSDWLEWVRVRVGGECYWVNLREETKCLNPTLQNSRWPPSSTWVRMNEQSFILCKWLRTNLGKCEWVWQEKLRWLNPRWQNSRWLPSSSWVRMIWVWVRLN